MHIRKIAAAAGFACGAAMAFAPLAQAAPDPGLVTDTLSSEINLQNSIFETYAALSGATVHQGGDGVYDTLTNLNHDAPALIAGGTHGVAIGEGATYGEVTPLETYLYGANPILAGISGASGPYNEFNGALTQFYDAYNVYAYAAANGGNLDTNVADYLGSATNIGNAISGPDATVSSAAQYFLNFGLGDLKGYDAIFSPDATSAGDIYPIQANEIVQLNNIFELEGKLAGVYGDIAPNAAPGTTNVGFDTIATDHTNSIFDQLVFGFNPDNVSGDPGSYDILNGAVTELYNAVNVGDYSLLNGGDLLPADLIFGTHDFVSGAGDTVSSAIGEYLQLAASDLAGYFDFGSALGTL